MGGCPAPSIGGLAPEGVTQSLNPRTRSEWKCMFTNQYGDQVEIGNIIDQLSIYESIYNNCMFGEVILKDGQGFSERHNIIGAGHETIHVEIETPGNRGGGSNLDKVFRVNSYSNAVYTSDGTGMVYSHLGFVSPYLFLNNATRISRSFSAMTSSEIVDYVTYDILKLGQSFALDWDDLVTNVESKHLKDIVVPSWNPFKLMNFLCSNTVSSDGSSNYFFYENNEGFHFNTIDNMKSKEVMRTYTVGINLDLSKSVQGGNPGHINIRTDLTEQFENTTRFDHARGQQSGLYGGRMFAHNILTKQLNTYDIEYDNDEVALGMAGLNGAGQFLPSPEAHVGFMPDEYMYAIHDKEMKSFYAYRDMKISETKANNIKFDIAGDTNVWAGDKIFIHVPTNMKDSDREEDIFISGEWIVTAIHHKINNTEYVCTLECMKDGFEEMP